MVLQQDLATAFIKVLGNPKASKQVYNISGSKYVTFDGLARACAKVILTSCSSFADHSIICPWVIRLVSNYHFLLGV